jgi:hypothetical protein
VEKHICENICNVTRPYPGSVLQGYFKKNEPSTYGYSNKTSALSIPSFNLYCISHTAFRSAITENHILYTPFNNLYTETIRMFTKYLFLFTPYHFQLTEYPFLYTEFHILLTEYHFPYTEYPFLLTENPIMCYP